MLKVNIIGKSPQWHEAPDVSDKFDTWGITQLMLRRSVDLVIDMNVYDDMRWGSDELLENLLVKRKCKSRDIPYIGLDDYPIDEIVEFFGVDYFSNTVDYAIALAIYMEYKEIDIYGIDMIHGSEYQDQKPGVDFWCGVAIGKGIKVKVHGAFSSIMKTKDGLLYGYDIKQKQQRKG